MKRRDLEHILRAAAAITGADRFVIVGSQAILGQFPDAPPEFLVSIDADLYSPGNTSDTELIEGSIGEASPFHQTFGYYAHGVAEETAILPEGWRDRLVPISSPSTGGATGLCLEVHDLAVSKLVAGRPKDLEFLRALFRHNLASASTVDERLLQTRITDALRELCKARLARLAA